ncbi:phasin family protein [Noviherbaspirillum humi]|uniref:Phasin family protein n=1 Tax=Noviherbaspirillum humi TaxID=1688639 RepID=A0A239KF13_9BURK|nr:phasin family protein [Noviherbaspirillum humi]SNT16223.1 phasin family protein [Noviherbaspirillum humi]
MFPAQQNPFASAARSGMDNQIAFYNALTSTAIESMEKLATLNLTAMRASIEESAEATRQLLGAKNVQEFVALLASQARPTMEKAVAYSGHVSNIATGAQAELVKATEQRFSDVGRRTTQAAAEMMTKLPVSLDDLTAYIKAGFENANPNRLFAAAMPAARAAQEVVSASVTPMTQAAAQTAQAASTAADKKDGTSA